MTDPDTLLPHVNGKPLKPDFIIKVEKPILFYNLKRKWMFKSLLFNLKVRLKKILSYKRNH